MSELARIAAGVCAGIIVAPFLAAACLVVAYWLVEGEA